MRSLAARAWAPLVRLRHERLARYDDRTLVLVAVLLAVALGAVNGLSRYEHLEPAQLGALGAGGLLASAAVTLGLVRGRLGDVESALCLLVLVVAATVQSLATPPGVDRWPSVYGLAGVPVVALVLTRRRSTVLVTAAAVAAQVVVLASTHPPLRELVTSVVVVIVCLPVFVGFTAVVLRRSEALRQQAQHDAHHDHLTGLLNRHGMARRAPALFEQARARGLHVGVLVLDVDHFKHVNDTSGHDGGDAVLSALGAGLAAWVRDGDVPVRLGGEEFAVLGLHDDLAGAARAGERLRAGAAAVRVVPELRITVSVGVATTSLVRAPVGAGRGPQLPSSVAAAAAAADAELLSRLLTAADSALYRAKAGGRDRVEVADEDLATAAGGAAPAPLVDPLVAPLVAPVSAP